VIRPGLVLLLLGALVLPAQAQSPPPRDASISTSNPIATGRITGVVTVAESGDPLRNARVVLSPAAGDAPLALTNAEGRFAFNLLPPGTYTVSASKSGYASSASLQLSGTKRPTVIQVSEGATIAGVTVPLAKGAAI
jgi:hypothetical protein